MELPEKVKQWAMQSIAEWPSLFKFTTEEHSIMSALDHLYYTLGNGFYWAYGEPVEIYPEEGGGDDREEFPNNYIPFLYCAGCEPKEVKVMSPDWIQGFIWLTEKYIQLGEAGVLNQGKLVKEIWGREVPHLDFPDYYDLKNEPDPLVAYTKRFESYVTYAHEVLASEEYKAQVLQWKEYKSGRLK